MFIFQRKMKANVGEGKEEYKNVWLDYVSLDFSDNRSGQHLLRKLKKEVQPEMPNLLY